MLHHVMVEDVFVGDVCKEEVQDVDAEEGDRGEGEKLARDVVSWPCGGGGQRVDGG